MMCCFCQGYSSPTGSGAATTAPASPTHKRRGVLQHAVLTWTFTWVLLPHKQETKDAVKRDRMIRGNTQLGFTWDPETDLSTAKKVRGLILENNGKQNPLSAPVAASDTQSSCLGNYTTNWAGVASSQGASLPDKKRLRKSR